MDEQATLFLSLYVLCIDVFNRIVLQIYIYSTITEKKQFSIENYFDIMFSTGNTVIT